MRQRLVVIGLGRDLSGDQVSLALEFRLRLRQGRLRADDGRLRRVDLELVGLRLDREQRRALLDEVAVLVADRLHEALHARDEIDRVDRRGVAGRFEIARDLLLDRRGDRDLRRRRRGVLVVLAASGGAGATPSTSVTRAIQSRVMAEPFFKYACKSRGDTIAAVRQRQLRSDFSPALARTNIRGDKSAAKCNRRHDGADRLRAKA